jgi:hypothetical protein
MSMERYPLWFGLWRVTEEDARSEARRDFVFHGGRDVRVTKTKDTRM